MYAKILKDSDASRKAWLKRGLGIARKDMPQIKSADMPEFFEYAKAAGVGVTQTTVEANTLKPSQNELNPAQVAQMPEEALRKPITVSADHYVLDGHNRWARMLELNPSAKIAVNRIESKVRAALRLMQSFPKAFKKTVEDIGATK